MREVETTHRPHLKDVPAELIHRIQTLLPVKEAGRTCVLSKSWMHAWSTIPTLRFRPPRKDLSKRQLIRYTDLINRTLQRYHMDNIPITSFDLHFRILDQISISFANEWIQTVASRSCLKEIYLTLSLLDQESITLSDELFLGENLETISVKADPLFRHSLSISNNLVMNCVKLRVLELINMTLSDETLVKLLSTCILLEKINLSQCEGLTRIKVKNLHYLRELEITSRRGYDQTLEIYDLPSLHIFTHNFLGNMNNFISHSLKSVRELFLNLEIISDAYSYVISKFPFLESLSLDVYSCKLNMLDIGSVSLKRLKLCVFNNIQTKIDIKVSAPKLDNFHYTGESVPGLLFPSIAPGQVEITLVLLNHINVSFVHKTREVLNLVKKFEIRIIVNTSSYTVSFNNDIEDMSRRIPIPDMNVKRLTFYINSDNKVLWDRQRLLVKAFISILRPNYLTVDHWGIRGFVKLIAREMMRLKTEKEHWPDLKNIEIQNRVDEKWITLTSSWISSPNVLACLNHYDDLIFSRLNAPESLISRISTTITPSFILPVNNVRVFHTYQIASIDCIRSSPPPKKSVWLEGCDFKHWLVIVKKPEGSPTRDQIIDSFINTLAKVVGSYDEARMKIYSVLTRGRYYGFGARVSSDDSFKLEDIPGVLQVLPDSYMDVQNKDYGGEPFIDAKAAPYHPKYRKAKKINKN